MFDLRLSPEQLEIRDTVRDFVSREIKPVALASARLEAFERPLLTDLLVQASRLGLRTLALSEDAGGAGADALTCCIVTEELAAGDPDIAAVLAHTAALARQLERAMTAEQRGRFLPQFVEDHGCHLAVADGKAVRNGGENVLNGANAAVANAPVAKMFLVRTDTGALLVPRDAPGVSVREQAGDWYHGSCGEVIFSNCRVPGANLVGAVGKIPLPLAAISLGIGRAAYEAALDYARIRVQGGKPIIGHQAIAAKLAGIAISLEVARASVWRAAWASDHPEALADRSLPDLPLQTVADAFAPEAMLRAVKDAAECFGAMGVMRDMPLHKYVRDARVCLHSGEGERRREAERRRRNSGVGMDFDLSEEQRAWRAKARKFADEEIRPISLERDAISDPAKTWDWEIIRKGSRLGFRTMAVPREWGGEGTDFVTQALVMAELARADSAIAKSFSQCWKWSHLIAASCTEEQKQRFLKPFLADDTFVLGKGISEYDAGSDNRLPPADDPRAGLKLRAERRGDEWILNGVKAYIANGNIGKLFFIDARTDPGVPLKQGTTMFLVPRDTPGFRTGKVFNKSGWRFYQNGEMIFENARVPHANVVGEVNGAVKKSGGAGGDTTGGDLFGDLELAANALGICDDACETALAHARSAKQGGRLLFEQQLVQLKLNRMHMLTEALRSFVMRIAWEHDRRIHSPNAGLAMNFSTDVVQEVTEIYMDVRGGAGGSMDAHAEKLVRDSFIWSHLAGDTVQRLKIAGRLAR